MSGVIFKLQGELDSRKPHKLSSAGSIPASATNLYGSAYPGTGFMPVAGVAGRCLMAKGIHVVRSNYPAAYPPVFATVAQRIERHASNVAVVGSSPTRRSSFLYNTNAMPGSAITTCDDGRSPAEISTECAVAVGSTPASKPGHASACRFNSYTLRHFWDHRRCLMSDTDGAQSAMTGPRSGLDTRRR